MDDIQIRVVKDKKSEWELLLDPWCDFFYDNVLMAGIKDLQDHKNKPHLRYLLEYNAGYDEESPCVLAWDTKNNKAAGMIVGNTLHKTPRPELEGKPIMDYFTPNWDEETLKSLHHVDDFDEAMIANSDLWSIYKVEKGLLINIISVGRDYRRKGLANQMTDVFIEEAKRRGYPLALSQATSAFTQKSEINRFGFKSVLEYDYKDHFSGYGKIPEDLLSVHTKGVVLVKML